MRRSRFDPARARLAALRAKRLRDAAEQCGLTLERALAMSLAQEQLLTWMRSVKPTANDCH